MSGILIGAAHNLQKPKTVRAYGVSWAGGTSTQLTRLGDAAGFADPVPAVGTGEGSSPFDNIMPWAGMKEYNVVRGALAYEKGVNPEFSRTAYDVVISIPKFWFKVETSGAEWRLWIANGPKDGFVEHPAFEGKDFIYYGRYATGPSYVSRSGQSPLVTITRAACRTGSRNKDAYWDMLNIAAYTSSNMQTGTRKR